MNTNLSKFGDHKRQVNKTPKANREVSVFGNEDVAVSLPKKGPRHQSKRKK
jgi:hypothetical protein